MPGLPKHSKENMCLERDRRGPSRADFAGHCKDCGLMAELFACKSDLGLESINRPQN